MSKYYENDTYDAIVVGTGISGGWAAKELSEKGFKTLVLERGRMVKHIEDYPTMNDDPWDYKFKGQLTREEEKRQQKQSRTGYTTNKSSAHWFVDDVKHPYNETKRFDWMRGYHVGGRSIMWGRHSYRLSDLDFAANKNDGHGVDWPIRYKDIAPWYDYVESFIGVSGENLGLSQLPDGKFLPHMPLNCVEDHLKKSMSENFTDGRVLTAGRVAHITGDKEFEGRSNCQYRNRCIRGCPYGAYFSSNSSTLPAAERTGNMTLRPNSVVHEVVYDPETKLATGVKIIDAETKEEIEFKANVIFLCASAIASTSILMQSKSDRFENGMGNDSGELGHNVMDHHFRAGASAKYDGFEDKYYKGRKPNGIYLPRFRNLKDGDNLDFKRGYGY
ncbi:MAG TPA: GMC family oxidoreductase, partial [Salegentibacter sp.]|nr:GMC family oxidoreductase [Salegentibacter sp.]